MKAVVVYESMYGNTHLIADAIGEGLREHADVVVVPVERAGASMVVDAGLVVVGGPTHVHGMSRTKTRKAAVDVAQKPDSDLEVDPDAEGPGLRDWFQTMGVLTAAGAAFDTRIDMSALLTGRASKGIARKLHEHGCVLIADPESFLVTKASHLEPDEAERARAWGARLGASKHLGKVSSSPE